MSSQEPTKGCRANDDYDIYIEGKVKGKGQGQGPPRAVEPMKKKMKLFPKIVPFMR